MLNKILQRTATALLCALVVIYIVIQISTALSTEIVTEYAGRNTIEDKIEVTSYVLRDETVLSAKADGVVHSPLAEGERVALKQPVATVYKSDTASQVQSEIHAINEQLSVLEASVIDTNYATSTVSKQDQSIYATLHENRAFIENNKYNLAVQNHADLLVSLNKRQLIVGKVDDFSDKIKELNAKKKELTASLTNALETIKAPKAGFFSSQIDGYETIFTKKALDTLTVNSFEEMLGKKPKKISEKTVGKIIGDFNWYLLCPVERSQAASFTEGFTYQLAFPYSSDVRIDGKLTKKVMQTDSDRVILVFSANAIPREFNYSRSQTVQIILKSYSGLQIVKSALRQIDGVEGVYVLQGGTVTFKKVRRIHENEGYYLVEQLKPNDPEVYEHLKLYDSVIVRGKNLYVGKVVD